MNGMPTQERKTVTCRHRHAVACLPVDDGTTPLAPYIYPPREPLGLFIPQLTPSRRHRYADVEKILKGEPHAPVVYFARVGRNIKIGTTGNLRARMRGLYLSLDDVLAVVPGDKGIEDLYHQRFAATRVADRPELFRPSLRLYLYLARCQWSRAEVGAALATAAIVAAIFGTHVVGTISGVMTLVVIMVVLFARPGWRWQ